MSTIHNLKDKVKSATKAKTESKITWWGFTWRSITWFLLFAAAIVAVVFGMHFGIAYVAGLGLAESVTTLISGVIAVAGYLFSGWAGLKCSNCIADAYNRWTKAEAPAAVAPAAEEPAPAAAAAA